MRKLVFGILTFLFFHACANEDRYKPETQLSKEEQSEFKREIVRFVGHLPKYAEHATKFEQRFDSAYNAQAELIQLDKYFANDKDGYTYFEVSRIAPSFKKKYVATGGRLKRNSAGELEEYEEIYRTWKMEPAQLAEKTKVFFSEMVAGHDLSPYYTENIGDTEHIEFPDKNTYYDKEVRKWQVRMTEYSMSPN
ncbi:hypothetical protein [Sphingobacterium griseoflavum]|nr:hypothetical protein [Sphingobacterium griseoflavum]